MTTTQQEQEAQTMLDEIRSDLETYTGVSFIKLSKDVTKKDTVYFTLEYPINIDTKMGTTKDYYIDESYRIGLNVAGREIEHVRKLFTVMKKVHSWNATNRKKFECRSMTEEPQLRQTGDGIVKMYEISRAKKEAVQRTPLEKRITKISAEVTAQGA